MKILLTFLAAGLAVANLFVEPELGKQLLVAEVITLWIIVLLT